METTSIRSRTVLRELSIYGALFFLFYAIVGSIVLRGMGAVVFLGYVVAWSVAMAGSALKALRRPRFWVFLLMLVGVSAVAMGEERDVALLGMSLSSQGLSAGVQMGMRAVTIVVATRAFSKLASIGQLSALFARLGAGEIGFLLGTAVNLLPLIQTTTSNVLLAMRLRGGFRRHRIKAVKRMAVTILVSTLRQSDDVVCAAEARGFTGTLAYPAQIAVTVGDRVLWASSAVLMAALVAVQVVVG